VNNGQKESNGISKGEEKKGKVSRENTTENRREKRVFREVRKRQQQPQRGERERERERERWSRKRDGSMKDLTSDQYAWF
jgi:hypothetical protein